MFTGIIEDIGELEYKDTKTFIVSTILDDINVSDSISVNGICLTVENIEKKYNKNFLKFSVSLETLKRTNLGVVKIKDKLNLERSLKLGLRLHGHIVTGHIDTTIKLIKIKNEEFIFELPAEFEKYIVEKGSVALDGISLTVAKKLKDSFSVAVIPYTLNHTTLKYKKPADVFNLEVDILAKYIESLTNKDKKEKIDLKFLKEYGFA
ncbi:MAG: riboflavin synthase [Endomicrobia bacterium]|nr:riboflavin synthase [Endomicrobiia bacterium]